MTPETKKGLGTGLQVGSLTGAFAFAVAGTLTAPAMIVAGITFGAGHVLENSAA